MRHDTPIDIFVQLLKERAPRPFTIQEMARMLAIERYDRKRIRAELEAQVANHRLRHIGKTRYQWVRPLERASAPEAKMATIPQRHGKQNTGRVEGHYSRVRAGYGFVEVLGRAADRFHRDILIPAGMEGQALHGDRVLVEIVRRDPRLRRVVGRIAAVTGPVHTKIIGTLEQDRRGWRLVPENELLPTVEILGEVPPRRQDAGLIALVQLTRPPTPTRPPGGVIERVMGAFDDPEVQFLTIAYEHGLRVDFPPEVMREAERLPSDPTERDLAGREDLRALPFVTIDGETARDFDDAVCLDTQPHGGYRLWVAIADVSHYIQSGSALDAEALLRGTSVYFPDRAIPMLPPQLSNTLCSLNPNRERLVLVAEMAYDCTGVRRAARFCRAVIKSRARLTYTQVAALLSQADSAEIRTWRAELSALIPQLRLMHDLMGKLYQRRIEKGSLDLDLPEALIDVSEEGRSVGVRLFQRNDAHRIIEEFMLEANRAVASHLRDEQIPFPYRIHEPPDPDGIDDLNLFLQPFGFSVSYGEHVRPDDVQALLRRLQGHRLARVLSRQVLRSLTQAQYSTTNAGHFGLAFPIYCHFTSPIRRYPDLLVHRQLSRVFDGHAEAARSEAPLLEAASVQSSQAEREAMEAERAMLDLRKAEFMLDHLLEPEAGTIVSVTSFGFFVELDAYPIEGLVRSDDLSDDRYYFVEAEQSLKGMRKGQRFRLGDRVLVEAINVSLRRRQIDFTLLKRLAPAIEESSQKASRRAQRAQGRSSLARQRRR
jgi:ribonuclease R